MKKFKLFIGIDISKKWFDVALGKNGDRSTMLHKRFNNTLRGFKAMYKWIKSQSPYCMDEWLFCMEHTGLYILKLCHYLENQKLAYVVESPLQINKSLGIKRGKSDKMDSKDIAYYLHLKRNELKLSTLPSKTLLELKALNTQRSQLVKYKKALMTCAKEQRAFVQEQYSQTILEDAQDIVDLIKMKIKKIENRIQVLIKDNSKMKHLYDLITSVKGIGPVNAVLFLIHTNGFTRFETPRQYACYIGVAPFGESSGSTVNKPARVNKMANKKLKAALTQAANAAIQYDKELKKYYKRKKEQGKNHFSVLNAVKSKLVHRVFAVVKRGTPFVELARYA